MMAQNLFVCIQLLIILYAIGRNNFFYSKHLYILIGVQSFSFISFIFISSSNYALSLGILFYIIIFVFSYIRLQSIFLVSLYYLIQNALLTFVWIAGHDLPGLFLGWNRTSLPILSIIIQSLIFSLSLFIIYSVNKRSKLWEHLNKYSKPWLFWGITIIFCSNFLLIYKSIVQKTDTYFNDYLYLSLFFVGFSTILVLFFFLIVQTYSSKSEINHLINKAQHNNEFLEMATEFQHDYKAFIYTSKRYLELEDFTGLKNYLSSLENYSLDLLNYSDLIQVQKLENPAIQGLLINCIEQCYKKKIKIFLDIQEPLHQEFFSTIDFSRGLSILINNAIEHTNGKVYIRFSNRNGTGSCSIRNTSDTPIKIEKIFKRNFSTKKNHRGIGLSILKNIIKTYSHTDLVVENINNWVSFTIKSYD